MGLQECYKLGIAVAVVFQQQVSFLSCTPSMRSYLLVLSLSASRGPVFSEISFERDLLDQGDTWSQGFSACDIIFHNIL